MTYKISDFSFAYPYQQHTVKLEGTFEISQNDIVLLSGNSGSGKTTLLYALKGLIPNIIYGKMEGKILYNNKLVTALSEKEKLEIGLLFQNPDAQMINKTVLSELAFGAENIGLPREEITEKINYLAMEFKIKHLLDREIITLSGGEKQKVALLSILLMDPRVILFDEPTAFLDPDSAAHFISVFKKIYDTKTIVIVEHNLSYLKHYVNKIITIKDEQISYISPNNFIWERPFSKIEKISLGKEILKLENLTFGYKKYHTILKNLNLAMKKGEIIGIIGANGAGKSTLLKLIAKLIKPLSGKIFLYGKENYSYKSYYGKVGLLWQNPENHFLFQKVKDEVKNLSLFGLEHLKEHNPFTLSEGEKRRLSLAIAFDNKSDLILMDEPTFGQDYENKLKLRDILNNMRKNGTSFVMVSHDLPFLKAVADKIYKLEDGTLVTDEKN